MKNSSPTNNFSFKKIKNYAQFFFFFFFFFFWTYLLLYSQLPNTRSQITCHLPFSFFPYQNHLQFGSFYKNFSFFFIHHSPILQSLFLLLLIVDWNESLVLSVAIKSCSRMDTSKAEIRVCNANFSWRIDDFFFNVFFVFHSTFYFIIIIIWLSG